jgi:hypothetical protein
MSAYYLLYFTCYVSKGDRISAASSLQAAAILPCGDPKEVMNIYMNLPLAVQGSPEVIMAMKTMRALSTNVDFVTFSRIWHSADESTKAFLEVNAHYDTPFVAYICINLKFTFERIILQPNCSVRNRANTNDIAGLNLS